jgi:hypothetical protein
MIAEPFDFESTDGSNALLCYADLQRDSGTNQFGEYLIVNCTRFPDKWYFVTSLCLKARHFDILLIEMLTAGKSVNVNASWLRGGIKWTHEIATSGEKAVLAIRRGGLIGSAEVIEGAEFGLVRADPGTLV